jgi:hyperosmotically inducible protein
MVRGLIHFVLIAVVIVAVAAFFFGYRIGRPTLSRPAGIDRPVATTGDQAPPRSTPVDRPATAERGREVGAEIGEKVAVGASEAKDALKNAALTAKIKSKMTLDDTLKGTSISVDTTGTVVTLTGHVATAAQKQRALQLTRETEGVTQVVDHLTAG